MTISNLRRKQRYESVTDPGISKQEGAVIGRGGGVRRAALKLPVGQRQRRVRGPGGEDN
jgi:hypothetical protein